MEKDDVRRQIILRGGGPERRGNEEVQGCQKGGFF